MKDPSGLLFSRTRLSKRMQKGTDAFAWAQRRARDADAWRSRRRGVSSSGRGIRNLAPRFPCQPVEHSSAGGGGGNRKSTIDNGFCREGFGPREANIRAAQRGSLLGHQGARGTLPLAVGLTSASGGTKSRPLRATRASRSTHGQRSQEASQEDAKAQAAKAAEADAPQAQALARIGGHPAPRAVLPPSSLRSFLPFSTIESHRCAFGPPAVRAHSRSTCRQDGSFQSIFCPLVAILIAIVLFFLTYSIDGSKTMVVAWIATMA